MRTMAAVMHEQGRPAPYATSEPFRIEEVDLAGPGTGEVLVEVRAAGLCHSDLSVVAGLRKRTLPTVGGHEGAGIVREVGTGVRGLEPGDHVVMSAATGCGRCVHCVRGRQPLCENIGTARTRGVLPNGERRLSLSGQPVYHYSGLSCFARYAVTVQSSLVKIDPETPLDIAAMFGCAVATGAGAVFNAARPRPGATVAVIGLGGVGMNVVMAARIAGAQQIIGVDLLESKLELARELGCTDVCPATEPDVAEKIRDISHGGVDYAFELSGSRPGFAVAMAATRKGGEIVCVGLGAADDLYQFPHAQLVTEEKVIRGSLIGSGVGELDIPILLRY
jgi:Zn-dependent alcohol dehydrogenase